MPTSGKLKKTREESNSSVQALKQVKKKNAIKRKKIGFFTLHYRLMS